MESIDCYSELIDYLNEQIKQSLISDQKIINFIKDINEYNSKTKNQKYYIRNKEKYKQYYLTNKEKYKKYYEDNKDKIKEKYNENKVELAKERYKKKNNGSLENFTFNKRGRPPKHLNFNEEEEKEEIKEDIIKEEKLIKEEN